MSHGIETIRRSIIDAGVWQDGHLPLNSDKHSNVKLDMEQLLRERNWGRMRVVMTAVSERLERLGVDGMVPVPNGALELVRQSFSVELPPYVPSEKLGKREFDIRKDWSQRIVQRAGRLAIFEDVVTTGGASLAMAQTVRDISPDVELDLVGIWRRGELDPAVDERFATQSFLIEEPIPAWLAEECVQCQAV